MNHKILFVDDDENILNGFRRQLRSKYEIETAVGPEKGLEAVGNTGPYAVVVSDLRMPNMNGIQFLSRIQDRSIDSVRVMLTGNADLQDAIDAVNEGNIYKFMTKPVSTETLLKVLDSSIQQYELIIAERELLQKTLAGSVKVLVDVLSLSSPVAFSRASRLKVYVKHIAETLQIPNSWQYELAALLSQIGCVALPSDVLDRNYAGEELTAGEIEMLHSHPAIGYRLLFNIPRLQSIARIIEKQYQQVGDLKADPTSNDPVDLGAQMLRLALEFDEKINRGFSVEASVALLKRREGEFSEVMLNTLLTLKPHFDLDEHHMLTFSELTIGMIIDQDVRSTNNMLLVAKGQEVTYAVLERLRCWTHAGKLLGQIRVCVHRNVGS